MGAVLAGTKPKAWCKPSTGFATGGPINKMPILAFTRDAVADSFIPTVCFADL